MSKDLNKVICTGRLGADPELRRTGQGALVCTFQVASRYSRRDPQTGGWANEVEWFQVVAWSNLAQHCASTLRKGDRVYVEGRLSSKKNGDAYSSELMATDVLSFSDRQEQPQTASSEAAAAAAYPPGPALPTSALPASPEEAEQRFYARYAEQIGGQSWACVQQYLGTNHARPKTVDDWLTAARFVRDSATRRVPAVPRNMTPGAVAARERQQQS